MYDELSPEQRRAMWATVERGFPARIRSGTLGEVVYWVHDQQAADELKQQGITEVRYTLAEVREIQGKSPDFLREIHRIKREFNATLQRTSPKPVLQAGRVFLAGNSERAVNGGLLTTCGVETASAGEGRL